MCKEALTSSNNEQIQEKEYRYLFKTFVMNVNDKFITFILNFSNL